MKAKARERQAEYYGNQYESGLVEKLPQVQSTKARDELGEMAGVSSKTYEHAAAVLNKARLRVGNFAPSAQSIHVYERQVLIIFQHLESFENQQRGAEICKTGD